MAIATSTLDRLLREHVTPGPGYVLAKGEEAALLADLQARMTDVPGAGAQRSGGTMGSRAFVAELTWKGSDRDWYHDTRLAISVDADRRLHVGRHYAEDPPLLTALADLVPLARAIVEETARRDALAARRDKVRGLKAQVVVANVRKLAEEEEFTFHARADSQKVEVWVSLGPNPAGEDIVVLHIPFATFQEQMARLRDTIRALRALLATGIRFRVASPAGFRPRDFTWTNAKGTG